MDVLIDCCAGIDMGTRTRCLPACVRRAQREGQEGAGRTRTLLTFTGALEEMVDCRRARAATSGPTPATDPTMINLLRRGIARRGRRARHYAGH